MADKLEGKCWDCEIITKAWSWRSFFNRSGVFSLGNYALLASRKEEING